MATEVLSTTAIHSSELSWVDQERGKLLAILADGKPFAFVTAHLEDADGDNEILVVTTDSDIAPEDSRVLREILQTAIAGLPEEEEENGTVN